MHYCTLIIQISYFHTPRNAHQHHCSRYILSYCICSASPASVCQKPEIDFHTGLPHQNNQEKSVKSQHLFIFFFFFVSQHRQTRKNTRSWVRIRLVMPMPLVLITCCWPAVESRWDQSRSLVTETRRDTQWCCSRAVIEFSPDFTRCLSNTAAGVKPGQQDHNSMVVM